MDTRIERLETLLTMQDDTITRLSAELYAQQKEIVRMQRMIEGINDRLCAMEAGESDNARPPHY